MIRLLLWLSLYVLSLGTLSVEATYRDGLRIKLRGWPEIFRAKHRSKK